MLLNPSKPNFAWVIFYNSVRTAKKTQHLTITEINWLTLFKEIIIPSGYPYVSTGSPHYIYVWITHCDLAVWCTREATLLEHGFESWSWPFSSAFCPVYSPWNGSITGPRNPTKCLRIQYVETSRSAGDGGAVYASSNEWYIPLN
jgi:hypothetical protein